MAASQDHIAGNTSMGANLVADGATFRVWAPAAQNVYVISALTDWKHREDSLLIKQPDDRWTGFLPGYKDGTLYKFWVDGPGSSGPKRDPYARELENKWPNPACVLRSGNSFPWQDWTWKTPAFNDLIVYELHVGTFFGPDREKRVCKFLDVMDRLEYLVDLGVNAIEPLPIVEFNTQRSLGYNGSDIFSPEMDYEAPEAELDRYLALANRLLQQKGKAPLSREILATPLNQLKAIIDICHHYGIAVLLDVVYNHASSDLKGPDHPESIYFFDRRTGSNPNDSLYFTDQDHTGPVFAFWRTEVRQFLIDNAKFFIDEYHVDGFRYDQVTVIDKQNVGSGWLFCQDLNDTLKAADGSAINIAEYWGPDPATVRPRRNGGASFHANWHDGLRRALRGVLGEASGGNSANVHWQPVIDQYRAPFFPSLWRAVQYLESHDEVYRDRAERIPRVAGGGNSRTWFAASRSRVATVLLLTAPGIPMLFMGQEFYEDKKWSDDPPHANSSLIFWDGLSFDKRMIDFHRFTRELIWLRRKHPALRGEGAACVLNDEFHRIVSFQRWVDLTGRDLIIVGSLNESTLYNYRIPFPRAGRWFEVFNSDIYENWVNPNASGNGGQIEVFGPPLNGLAFSVPLTIPANSVLVFAQDLGD